MEYKELPYISPNGRVYDIMFSDKASIINLSPPPKKNRTNGKILNDSSLRNVAERLTKRQNLAYLVILSCKYGF